MKIRIGFVSNSSSSSYIVDIAGISLDDFLQTMSDEYGWKLFDRAKIKKEVYDHYNEMKDRLKKDDQNISGFSQHWYNMARADKREFGKARTNLGLVKFVFRLRGVTLNETNIGMEMSGNTSMHNDFGDMPELMREVTLFFLMDTTHKVNGRRKGD